METRYTHSPEDIRYYSTEQLRKEFLVEKVFEPNKVKLTYTHNDRMIFGGVMPIDGKLSIELSSELFTGFYWIGILVGVSVFSFSKEMVRTPSFNSALTLPSSSRTETGSAIVRENSPQ